MASREQGAVIGELALRAAESGRLPDRAIRFGIRKACANRLRAVRAACGGDPERALQTFLADQEQAPVAVATREANLQHYELPSGFFELVLGPRLKYSGCEWSEGDDLARAEARSLATVCDRARLEDGQRILELGCGWGSLTLEMAANYPNARIVAVSNSRTQREHVLGLARARGAENIEVVTADINALEIRERFDRIVTIEMLEHVRNHRALFGRFAGWLEPDGFLFAHVFRHRTYPYAFETEGSGNWMGRHFFTGGIMPCHDLLVRGQDALELEESWQIPGTHYEATANAWLQNLDARRRSVQAVLEAHYGKPDARRWLGRWRIFFMACAELFGFDEGRQWGVSHYRFRPRV